MKTITKLMTAITAVGITGTVLFSGLAQAQIAGSTSVGVTITEASRLALGWSAKKNILGKSVYNEANEKVGTIEDLIIAPDKSVSYAIIGAGGFVGIGRHDVAIPITQITDQGSRLVLAGASKEALKVMPAFEYASDSARRDLFIANAESDIAKAKAKIAELEKKAATANTEAKASMSQQIASMKKDVQVAEDKLTAMKKSAVKSWKEFEGDVNAATARLRKWVDTMVK